MSLPQVRMHGDLSDTSRERHTAEAETRPISSLLSQRLQLRWDFRPERVAESPFMAPETRYRSWDFHDRPRGFPSDAVDADPETGESLGGSLLGRENLRWVGATWIHKEHPLSVCPLADLHARERIRSEEHT